MKDVNTMLLEDDEPAMRVYPDVATLRFNHRFAVQ
jgi:hypothetical protein